MSKLETIAKVFEIGKTAVEIYDVFSDAKKKQREIEAKDKLLEEKDKRIAELEEEVKLLAGKRKKKD